MIDKIYNFFRIKKISNKYEEELLDSLKEFKVYHRLSGQNVYYFNDNGDLEYVNIIGSYYKSDGFVVVKYLKNNQIHKISYKTIFYKFKPHSWVFYLSDYDKLSYKNYSDYLNMYELNTMFFNLLPKDIRRIYNLNKII